MQTINDHAQDVGSYYVLTDGSGIRRRWHLNKLRLSHLIPIAAQDQVLDAGCGVGNLVFELAPLCRQAVGCDYRHPSLTFAAERGYGSYVQADLRQVPFPDETFTTVFCMEVIEHLDRDTITRALSELRRVLKPKGRLLLTTPNYRSPWIVIEFFADTLRLMPEMVGGEHISKFHQRTLVDLLTKAEFVIEKVGTFNHLSPFIAPLSERLAECLYRWELKAGWAAGNLLYVVCQKL